ncbi:hypothetical protein [Streptomyces sp. NPDC054837]
MLEPRQTGALQEKPPRLQLPQQAPPIDRTDTRPAFVGTDSGVEPDFLPLLAPLLAGLGSLL